jgi:hypothetical protein
LAEFGPNNQVHKIHDAMVYPDFLNFVYGNERGLWFFRFSRTGSS